MKQILIDARKLIEKPENWTQGTFARDAQGKAEYSCSPYATCWCAVGALHKVCEDGEDLAEKAWSFLNMHAGAYANAPYLNDTGKHADVLAMFDRAIGVAP
jgi:hypothetical protein